MWPWMWAVVHISQSLLILNVIEKPLRVVSGVPETRRNPSGLWRKLGVTSVCNSILKSVVNFDRNTESQTRTPKYSPMYVRANELARCDKFSLKVLYTISFVTA